MTELEKRCLELIGNTPISKAELSLKLGGSVRSIDSLMERVCGFDGVLATSNGYVRAGLWIPVN